MSAVVSDKVRQWMDSVDEDTAIAWNRETAREDLDLVTEALIAVMREKLAAAEALDRARERNACASGDIDRLKFLQHCMAVAIASQPEAEA